MFLCEGERLEDAVGDVAKVDRVAAVLAASVGLGHVGDHGLERKTVGQVQCAPAFLRIQTVNAPGRARGSSLRLRRRARRGV